MKGIRDILKKATKTAITWGASKLGVPETATSVKFLTGIADDLFTKEPGVDSGPFRPIDTNVQMPRFGGRMGYSRPLGSRGTVDYARTVSPETLYAAWDARLGKYYTQKYKVARTVKGKVV